MHRHRRVDSCNCLVCEEQFGLTVAGLKTTLTIGLSFMDNSRKRAGYCTQCAAASVVEVRLGSRSRSSFGVAARGLSHTDPKPHIILVLCRRLENFISLSWSQRSVLKPCCGVRATVGTKDARVVLPLTRGTVTVYFYIRCIRRALLTLTYSQTKYTGNAKLAAVQC